MRNSFTLKFKNVLKFFIKKCIPKIKFKNKPRKFSHDVMISSCL